MKKLMAHRYPIFLVFGLLELVLGVLWLIHGTAKRSAETLILPAALFVCCGSLLLYLVLKDWSEAG